MSSRIKNDVVPPRNNGAKSPHYLKPLFVFGFGGRPASWNYSWSVKQLSLSVVTKACTFHLLPGIDIQVPHC